jgi:hypothetical protein
MFWSEFLLKFFGRVFMFGTTRAIIYKPSPLSIMAAKQPIQISLKSIVLISLLFKSSLAQSPTPVPTSNCSDVADYCGYVTSYCNTTFCWGCSEAHLCGKTK